MKKKLIEMYGLKEGPFDDLNRQLGSAKSVARDPRAPQQKARVAPSGAIQKAQADLDSSKSVFAKEASMFGGGSREVELPSAMTKQIVEMLKIPNDKLPDTDDKLFLIPGENGTLQIAMGTMHPDYFWTGTEWANL